MNQRAASAQTRSPNSVDSVVAPGQELVLLAAGGTGGHMFPAEALAGVLEARGRPVAIATDARGAKISERLPGIPVYRIDAASPSGNIVKKLRGAFWTAIGLLQARKLIRRQRPTIVVGFGGYPSVPPLLAARSRGCLIVLHEQNAVLGKANRLMAPRASRIAMGFSKIIGFADGTDGRWIHTGNPVRSALAAKAGSPYQAATPDGPFRILIIGGSQGARVFSEIIPEALARLDPAARGRLEISQQCRAEDIEHVRERYKSLGIKAYLASFLNDVPNRLADAHLAITRAGASTIAEVTAVGRPAILVPYRYAADDHQLANALLFSENGGGWVLREPGHGPVTAENDERFTADTLASYLSRLMENPESLSTAAANAAVMGRPDAAERLGDLIETLLPERESRTETAAQDKESA